MGEGVGAPDGMKIDQEGNLYCCGPGGIHVFDARANCLGVVRMPEHTANFAWGDDDMGSLFITAATTLYRLRVQVPGLKVF
jgi:gluconolactonase